MRNSLPCLLALLLFACSPVMGQVPRTYPSEPYYQGLRLLREGVIPDALKAFEGAVRTGRTSIAGKWIDSIPGYVMLGECQYQLGNLVAARTSFDNALQLMLRNDKWLSSVQWQPILPSGRVPPNIGTWATSTRQFTLAQVPDTMNLLEGSHDTLSQIRQGGTIQQAQYLRVDVAEIMRTLAWCMYRRTQILGQLSFDDPLVDQFYATLAKIKSPPDVGARQWLDLILALSLIADNQVQAAVPLASRCIQLPGNLDHPLTPLALLTTANLLAATGQAKATEFYIEAAISGSIYGQYEIASEAMRIGVGPLAAQGSSALLATSSGAAMQMNRKSRLFAATAQTTAAESAIYAGRTEEAKRALQAARAVLARRDVLLPRLDSHAHYLAALLAYQVSNARAANESMEQAMAFAMDPKMPTTPHRYQLSVVVNALGQGSIGARTADALIASLSAGPMQGQWNREPVDALSATYVNENLSQTRLINYLSRGKHSEALQVADQYLGDRFRNALPLSGRHLDIRWLVSAHPSLLSPAAKQFRDKLPAPAKVLKNRLAEMVAIQKVLAGLPLVDANPQNVETMNKTWANLEAAAGRCEMAVGELSIRRLEIPKCFPPELGDKSQWPQLSAGNALLVFCPAGNSMVGMLWTGDKVTSWAIPPAATSQQTIAKVLQGLGVVRRRGGAAQLEQSDELTKLLTSLREQLLQGVDQPTLDSLRRIVIVPHGPLWYLPFELLPIDVKTMRRAGDSISISYAPTPGLALNVPPPSATGKETAVVVNRFFTPGDVTINNDLDQQILDAIDNAVRLPDDNALPSSLLSSRLRRITVASMIPGGTAPAAVSPLGYDQTTGRGTLARWLSYPWGAPEEVVLPGFQASQGGSLNGDEMFMMLCGLHAAGTHRVLISRWPVGGASTAALLSEYMIESEFSSPLESWQRSVLLLKSQDLDPALEPILNDGDAKGLPVTGDHPLFWSGYMMVGSQIKRTPAP